MKLEDVRENYQYYSQKTSDITRQLGFAGIALIWIFKNSDADKQLIPKELLIPTIFLITGLAFDLLHYVSGTLIWGIYSRRKELKNTKEGNLFSAPRQINWTTLFFFWAKIFTMILAYVFILKYFLLKLF